MASRLIDPASLTPWSKTVSLLAAEDGGGGGGADDSDSDLDPLAAMAKKEVRFPTSDRLNQKITLWHGNLVDLNVEAMVNPTNERLNDSSGISAAILSRAGPAVSEDLTTLESCRTGDAIISPGHLLQSKFIIHTVGPRYHLKYRNAAENALHNCYRNSLAYVREKRLKSVAVPCLYKVKKRYPREEAAHTAVRTTRRFLEHYGDTIDHVVLVTDNPKDYQIYKKVLPLYFPRCSAEEAAAEAVLPKNTGNEFGEIILEERTIRVAGGLQEAGLPSEKQRTSALFDEGFVSKAASDISEALRQKGFASMRTDPDEERDGAAGGAGGAEMDRTNLEELMYVGPMSQAYPRYLEKAATLKFTKFEVMNPVYVSGTDSFGRPVVVVCGAHFQHDDDESEQAFLFLLLKLEQVVNREYVLVYVHSNFDVNMRASFRTLKNRFYVLPPKYQRNLKRFYVVHPTLWLKSVLSYFCMFAAKNSFWEKVQFVDQLADLYQCFDAAKLTLPEHAFRMDQVLHEEVAHLCHAAATADASQ